MESNYVRILEYIKYLLEKQDGVVAQCPVCGFYICNGNGCILKEINKILEEQK